MRPPRASLKALLLIALSTLPVRVLGGDVIATDGFTTCVDNATISVNRMDVAYDRTTNQVTFDVSGTSSVSQNVTARIDVTAYGISVYSNTFNPCEGQNYVEQLCPVPAGTFSAKGQQTVPSEYASQIPSIAFTIPDLDGAAKLQLFSDVDKADLACIQSTVSNGRSMNVPSVKYVAAGIAGGALAMSALGGVAAGMHPGAASASPSFGEVVGWFQGMALNGMLSVQYPKVYQSFSKNFAFSTGLIPWASMQTSIDNFRTKTGGNLTEDSYEYLRNATLVFSNGANSSGSSGGLFKRGMEDFILFTRDSISTDVDLNNGNASASANTNTTASNEGEIMHYVHGIQAYVEQLSIPQANTFMTVLLMVSIAIAAITVGILLFKVVLEAFALGGNLPKGLESFRKRYWWRLAKTITNLILLLYGVWTLYCVYQFTNGDSWAAKLLAGVTWALFTGVLVFFTIKIILTVKKLKKLEGDDSGLYENKETWIKYSLFYDNFKKGYWWLFIPSIIYMFAKNAVVAGANGHGLAQTIGQGIVEICMLALLLWNRPYSLKSGNVINIIIQTVRVLSVVCVLIFVEELGIAQTTKTVTGIILIVVQGVLTGALAILIAVNAIIACVRMNPHRKRRKEAEKLNRDLDDLTPLDARNSLLMDPMLLADAKGAHSKATMVSPSLHTTTTNDSRYDPVPTKRPESSEGYEMSQRNFSRPAFNRDDDSKDRLIMSAAEMGGRERDYSPPNTRQPRLPDLELGSYR
ncbi:hypothetical protein AAFC00_001059 [Neodothiora populina]|uniref:ML-like domain-containing protein n=1 Tax=Neodothiora populina TaxID=2781224 RepID=A0ABR3PN17_9PEZI